MPDMSFFKSFFTLTIMLAVVLSSCDLIKDGSDDDCGIYLEFIYEHNMEYTDAFNPHVGVVDVFVFDEQGRYMFVKNSPREELITGKRMFLGADLPIGKYRVLTVGGLSGSFRVADAASQPLIPGQTRLEDVRIALKRSTTTVADRLPDLWVGESIEVCHQADLSVWPVHLIKETNHFDLLLSDASPEPGTLPPPGYTFEIVTTEGAVYGHDNQPGLNETVTFAPYRLEAGSEPGELSHAHISTARLVDGDYNYRLIVRNTQTGEVLWDYDLIRLLAHIKPDTRPDGTELPLQEFLDRQSEWHLVILYRGCDDTCQPPAQPGEYVAVGVKINGWIIWFNDIGV